MTEAIERRTCMYCNATIDGTREDGYCDDACKDLGTSTSKSAIYTNIDRLNDEDRRIHVIEPLEKLNNVFESKVTENQFSRSLSRFIELDVTTRSNDEFHLVAYVAVLMAHEEHYTGMVDLYRLAKKHGYSLFTKKLFNKHVDFILDNVIDFKTRCTIFFDRFLEECRWVQNRDRFKKVFERLSTWKPPFRGSRYFGTRDRKLAFALVRFMGQCSGRCTMRKGDGSDILGEYCTKEDAKMIKRALQPKNAMVARKNDLPFTMRMRDHGKHSEIASFNVEFHGNGKSYEHWIPVDDFHEWIEIIANAGKFRPLDLIRDLVKKGYTFKGGKALEERKHRYALYTIKRVLQSMGLLDIMTTGSKKCYRLNTSAREAIERISSHAGD